jgi:hypothetical protein
VRLATRDLDLKFGKGVISEQISISKSQANLWNESRKLKNQRRWKRRLRYSFKISKLYILLRLFDRILSVNIISDIASDTFSIPFVSGASQNLARYQGPTSVRRETSPGNKTQLRREKWECYLCPAISGLRLTRNPRCRRVLRSNSGGKSDRNL